MDRITAIAICEALLYELQPFDEQPKEALQMALDALCEQEELGKELTNAVELIHKKNNKINELQRIIEQYHRADGFLDAHGWKWN